MKQTRRILLKSAAGLAGIAAAGLPAVPADAHPSELENDTELFVGNGAIINIFEPLPVIPDTDAPPPSGMLFAEAAGPKSYAAVRVRILDLPENSVPTATGFLIKKFDENGNIEKVSGQALTVLPAQKEVYSYLIYLLSNKAVDPTPPGTAALVTVSCIAGQNDVYGGVAIVRMNSLRTA